MPTRRVLIVDDDPSVREGVRAALEIAGYEVHEAADGPEGLAKAAQFVPDVVLLDVGMPGLDGFEVCRRLKANPATARIPIVFLTAVQDPTLPRRVTAAGGTACVTKPFRLEGLMAVIGTVIEQTGR